MSNKSNFEMARNWHAGSIESGKIRMLVKSIIRATEKYGVWIYHVSKYDSVYLKFKDPKMGSVRIADHESKKTHLKYTWNILINCKDVPKCGMAVGNMNFYQAGHLSDFFKDLEYRHNSINQKQVDCSNLILKNEYKTGEKDMKTKNIAALLMDDCKTVGCSFAGGTRLYTYKTVEDFEVGDSAVVYDSDGLLTVVVVEEVHKVAQIDVDSHIQYKWIVQGIDLNRYIDIREREEAFNDQLLEVQQKSTKKNAINLLSEHLGVELDALKDTVKLLNGKW